MNNIRQIRRQLGLSQQELADQLGMGQANISHYEHGQEVPPNVAKKLIVLAGRMRLTIDYNTIYGPVPKRRKRPS